MFVNEITRAFRSSKSWLALASLKWRARSSCGMVLCRCRIYTHLGRLQEKLFGNMQRLASFSPDLSRLPATQALSSAGWLPICAFWVYPWVLITSQEQEAALPMLGGFLRQLSHLVTFHHSNIIIVSAGCRLMSVDVGCYLPVFTINNPSVTHRETKSLPFPNRAWMIS